MYLSAADERGMMVSFIQSNYMGFGSGLVVPGTGIALQNRGHGFSMDPASPNVVAGGKRPFHTIIPAFVTEEANGRTEAVMSFGVMGGDMQPQGHLQTIVRMLGYGQQPQAACCAPRWKVQPRLHARRRGDDEPRDGRRAGRARPYDQVDRRSLHGFRIGAVRLAPRSRRSGARLRGRERQPARRAGGRFLTDRFQPAWQCPGMTGGPTAARFHLARRLPSSTRKRFEGLI
ncbi:gamma-glutamyltransferase [Burkholderia cenocepacia]|uniref:gamma-glutamyltransferase n=1 Tax=Burkholderia cenocepacia TaxID=95486 RepID=UPI002D1F9DB2|nr:gamma-glutamyltransferase [Burkholderia cenocepacia]